MISLSRNKKGVEIQLRTAFEMAIAALVLILILKYAYGVGKSVAPQEQTIADDVGLLMDALQTVRPDVNLVANYPMPPNFGIAIESKKVTVFEKTPDDGRVFWFSEDPNYRFTYGTFAAKKEGVQINFFKTGNSAGVLQPSSPSPGLVMPYCPVSPHAKVHGTFEAQSLVNLGKDVIEVVSGEAAVFAAAESGTPVVKVFVNANPESAELACSIIQNLFRVIPNLEGFAIVPLNPAMMSRDDPMLAVASSQGLAAFVQISVPVVDSHVQANVGQGIANGVKGFVV